MGPAAPDHIYIYIYVTMLLISIPWPSYALQALFRIRGIHFRETTPIALIKKTLIKKISPRA